MNILSSVNFGFRTGSYNLRAAADDKIDKDASARSNPNSGLWSKIKEIFHNGILKFTTKKQGSGDKTTKSIRTNIVSAFNPTLVRRPADDFKASNHTCLGAPRGESGPQLDVAVQASIEKMKAVFVEMRQSPKFVEECRETAYALALSNASDTVLAQREKHPALSIDTKTGLEKLNAVAFDRKLTGSLGKDGRLSLKGAGMHALYGVFQNNMLFTAPEAKLGEEHKEQVCREIYTLCDTADHKLTGFKTALDAAYDKWAVENKLKKS
ncbi:hypothetical protein Sant_3939 [Sodalis praecaptivus]|uniref:Uncharacterized protein n=2 Tax=Sodalis praecaptivus TaxID=1239307 RepID=W0I2A2_9GAMM|nr:hypothetical protein Sant_3939 [Sodalis praecaptivus]